MRRLLAPMVILVACSGDPKSGGGAGDDTSDTVDLDGGPRDSDSADADDSGTTGDSGNSSTPSSCDSGSNPAELGSLTCMRQAACLWTGDQDYGSRGYAIDVGGDVNGDGWPDMIVGAPTEDVIVDDTIIGTDSGAVHIWLNIGQTAETPPAATVVGPVSGAYLGYSVAITPDTNGDGLDDILIGGRGSNTDGVLAGGTVMLVLGREGDWTSEELTADHTWSDSTVYSRAGSHVSGSEDLNGDGLGDMLIATNQKQVSSSGYETVGRGRVAIIYGVADLGEITSLEEPDAAMEGSGPMDGTGTAFATGDIDGDGHLEIIVGSPYGNSSQGRVDIIRGQSTPPSGTYTPALADLSLSGTPGSGFGYTLAIGDLNDDDSAEVVIGAPADDLTYDATGSVSVFGGAATLFDGSPIPASRLHGEFDDAQLGWGIQAGPDLNGDGVGDLVVGAIYAWRGLITKGGRVYGLHGPHTDWDAVTNVASAPVQVFGAATKDYLGRANIAADINEDGKAELFMGTGFSNSASTYDSGSVAMFWGE